MKFLTIIVRVLLSITYLWVVADRLSLLGPVGTAGVVWGDFDTFLNYTASLNPWFPREFSNILGYIATVLEVILGFFFLFGLRLKETSIVSVLLLMSFIVSMTFSLGLMQALDFIIFTVVITAASLFIYFMAAKAQPH